MNTNPKYFYINETKFALHYIIIKKSFPRVYGFFFLNRLIKVKNKGKIFKIKHLCVIVALAGVPILNLRTHTVAQNQL